MKQESLTSKALKGKKPRASTMSVRSTNPNDDPPLVSEEAGLYLWNLDGEQFEVVELNVRATIVKHENRPFDCEANFVFSLDSSTHQFPRLDRSFTRGLIYPRTPSSTRVECQMGKGSFSIFCQTILHIMVLVFRIYSASCGIRKAVMERSITGA